MTYAEARAAIDALAPRGWRLGLDRMQTFLQRAGLEDAVAGDRPKFAHVAGTNGKGSVTAYIQNILLAGGHRVGGYFSPFVYDFRERIQLDCGLIAEDDLVAGVEALLPSAATFDDGGELGPITEFEFKTALGFWFWRQKQCDWVALEVGLGGRLDATNVVQPATCAIVSIGMDHMEFLGDTLAAIAGEKAGIIKPGVPVVVGEMPDEAYQAILAKAANEGAPLYRVGEDVRYGVADDGVWIEAVGRRIGGIETGIRGVLQPHNAAVAVATILAATELDDASIRTGLARTKMPGRFEVMPRDGGVLVLDGAHNLDAARSLRGSLEQQYPGERFDLIWGMNQGHDPAAFLEELRGVVARVFTVRLDFHRTYEPEDLAAIARDLGFEAQACASAAGAMSLCGAMVVATGSFYLLAAVRGQ